MSITQEEKEKVRKALIGFMTTLLTAVSAKIVILIFGSQTFGEALNYLSDNFSFWFSALAASSVGGFFAQWKTADASDCPETEERK